MEFLEPFEKFLKGEEIEDVWGTGVEQGLVREFESGGEVRVVRDERWEGKMRVWRTMVEAQGFGAGSGALGEL